MVAVKELSDMLERIAFAPALPHQGLLGFRIVDPLSLLHGNTPAAPAALVCCIDRLNPQPVADIDYSSSMGESYVASPIAIIIVVISLWRATSDQ